VVKVESDSSRMSIWPWCMVSLQMIVSIRSLFQSGPNAITLTI